MLMVKQKVILQHLYSTLENYKRITRVNSCTALHIKWLGGGGTRHTGAIFQKSILI